MDSSPVLLPVPRHCRLIDNALAGPGFFEGIDPAAAPPQGYRIALSADGVRVTAADAAGLFYARQTLGQLRHQCDGKLPQGEIHDWPDFPARGVMLDVSRDKVPSMQTLFMLVDQFASLKINQLQLYVEHTFAYANHPAVWRDASPLTPEEVRQLDTHCRERFIELVPNQNSFGHMERWFKHPRYAGLAETLDEFTFPWGTRHRGGFSIAPSDPKSIEFLEGLYDELLPNFSSRLFNVGCDETFDLGLGKSRAECERRGKHRVYLDFLLKLYDAVKRRGRTMQFWGDIILHHPELIPELPRDVIALNWRYDATDPFDADTRAFGAAGIPFYVCPGTSSWLSISGRTDNAIGNLKLAASCGVANGAVGYLNTDWGDLGHHHYLPISFLGFAAGAAYSWCYESNKDLDIARALDAHVFRDSAGVMGKLMYDLGNVYQAVRTPMGMSTRLFWSLFGGEERRRLWEPITKDEYDDAEARVDEVLARLSAARMDRPDAELVKNEVRNTAAMLRHACRVGRYRLGAEPLSPAQLADDVREIVARHRALWLARNRPGGLADSVRRFEPLLDQYRGAATAPAAG
jgi:hypothetical protein